MIASEAGIQCETADFHSRRLWSLWDIMETFRADLVCEAVEQITTVMAGIKHEPDPNQFIPETLAAQAERLVAKARFIAASSSLTETSKLLQRLEKEYQQNDITYSRLSFQLEQLFELMKSELQASTVLIVDGSDGVYYDREFLFGRAVFDAFPSARNDVKEAGNSLACGRATATVFHLMRAAEIGLRALATDRRVKFQKRSNLPLEYREWGEILEQLEGKEREIECYTASPARDVQLAFYHGAMIELRAFKNKYRNPSAHTRISYDIHQARSAMQHAMGFMKIIAERIGEKTKTPGKWTDSWLKRQNAKSNHP
jgi:hypothetical protein